MGQTPVAQHLAITGSQVQWQQLGADAAQRIQLLQPAFEARVDRALDGDFLLAQPHGLLRRTPGQALLRGPAKRRLPA
ncbi:hypothetical protein D3C78_1788880 [compost metagenome]